MWQNSGMSHHWPQAELQKIALADEETKRLFVEWIKEKVMTMM